MTTQNNTPAAKDTGAIAIVEEQKRSVAVKPFSEQLAVLSARAKKAEDAAAAARTEAREAIQARLDKLQADASARGARRDAAATSVKDAVAGQWTTLQTQVKTGIDGIRADIDAKKREADAGHAERKADRAEDNAVAAIAFAYDAIDYAESAVLDAVIARSDADSFR